MIDAPMIGCSHFIQKCQFQDAKCQPLNQRCKCNGDARRCTFFDSIRTAGYEEERDWIEEHGTSIFYPIFKRINAASQTYNEPVPQWIYGAITEVEHEMQSKV